MTSLSFKAWLAPKILDKSKQHTVRAERKRPISKGELVQLFTAMRTTACQRLGEGQCLGAYKVTVESTGMIRLPEEFINIRAAAKDMQAWRYMPHNFAEDDGFDGLDSFMAFFQPHLISGPFTGDLIYWGDTLEPDTPPVFMSPEALRVMRHMLYVDRVESGPRPKKEWGSGNRYSTTKWIMPAHIDELETAGYLRRDPSVRKNSSSLLFKATIAGMRATGLPTPAIRKALSL